MRGPACRKTSSQGAEEEFKALPQRLPLNAAKVMSSSQVELPNAAEAELTGRRAPQGLKPWSYWPFSARLKSCPDTKHFFEIGSKQSDLDISFAVTNSP